MDGVMPEKLIDVNFDIVSFIEPGDGYTRIHYLGHYVDVKETPEEIRHASKLANY